MKPENLFQLIYRFSVEMKAEFKLITDQEEKEQEKEKKKLSKPKKPKSKRKKKLFWNVNEPWKSDEKTTTQQEY